MLTSRLQSTKMFGKKLLVKATQCETMSITSRLSISHKASVNGVDLHYEKVGNGSHAVMLLPGALGCTKTDFGPQLAKLNRDKYTIVGWDPRGYGKSQPPDRDFPVDFLFRDADDAAALMEKLGFSSYSLLGWSDGGNTAAILAAKYPDCVKKLVIWGSNAYYSREELELYTNIRDLSSWSDRMKQPMIEIYGESYFEKTWHSWVDIFIKMAEKSSGDTDLYKHEVPKIKAETLIIHGMKDALVPFFQPEYLHKHIKDSRLICWDDGKHNLHLRFSDKFNKTVEEFLDETTAKL